MDYAAWARAYSDIFPYSEQKAMFLKTHLKPGRLADIGCADGSYAIALAKEGNLVEGYDITKELIDIAIHRAKNNDNVSFNVLDMRAFLATNRYDSIYSIGNTLVHLKDIESIKKVIKQCYQSLKPGGRFIVQIVNYERILSKEIKTLPTLEGAHHMMQRRYSFNETTINFKTILQVGSESHENTVELYPLKKHQLELLAFDAGFIHGEFYSGFNDTPFNSNDAFALVAVFEK